MYSNEKRTTKKGIYDVFKLWKPFDVYDISKYEGWPLEHKVRPYLVWLFTDLKSCLQIQVGENQSDLLILRRIILQIQNTLHT